MPFPLLHHTVPRRLSSALIQIGQMGNERRGGGQGGVELPTSPRPDTGGVAMTQVAATLAAAGWREQGRVWAPALPLEGGRSEPWWRMLPPAATPPGMIRGTLRTFAARLPWRLRGAPCCVRPPCTLVKAQTGSEAPTLPLRWALGGGWQRLRLGFANGRGRL